MERKIRRYGGDKNQITGNHQNGVIIKIGINLNGLNLNGIMIKRNMIMVIMIINGGNLRMVIFIQMINGGLIMINMNINKMMVNGGLMMIKIINGGKIMIIEIIKMIIGREMIIKMINGERMTIMMINGGEIEMNMTEMIGTEIMIINEIMTGINGNHVNQNGKNIEIMMMKYISIFIKMLQIGVVGIGMMMIIGMLFNYILCYVTLIILYVLLYDIYRRHS